jgi:hypothetical protein
MTEHAVPENLVAGMIWGWPQGQLQFRFPGAKNEGRCLLALADWLTEAEEHTTQLAEFMLKVENEWRLAE